jgi:regulator of RNase E activity RraA
MTSTTHEITLDRMRESFYSGVIADILDTLGLRHQSPHIPLPPVTGIHKLVGRCKTTRWIDLDHEDPNSYEGELKAVDSCQPDDVVICAAGGSMRSAIWGELLSTASRNGGCVGAIVDGAVRDIAHMEAMQFPVFARGTSVHDSMNRQKVAEYDLPVEIAGAKFCPGDLVIADRDGVVVIPRKVEAEVIQKAWKKINDEDRVRSEISNGMKAQEAYKRFGVL